MYTVYKTEGGGRPNCLICGYNNIKAAVLYRFGAFERGVFMVQKDDLQIISIRIKEARESRGMNQAQLAQKAGITPAAISQIEKGERVPTTPVLKRIADVLQVSLDFLAGRTDESKLEDLLQNENLKAFYKGFKNLNPQDQEIIRKNIEFLKSKYRRGDSGS